jgi:hypothetical protein
MFEDLLIYFMRSRVTPITILTDNYNNKYFNIGEFEIKELRKYNQYNYITISGPGYFLKSNDLDKLKLVVEGIM